MRETNKDDTIASRKLCENGVEQGTVLSGLLPATGLEPNDKLQLPDVAGALENGENEPVLSSDISASTQIDLYTPVQANTSTHVQAINTPDSNSNTNVPDANTNTPDSNTNVPPLASDIPITNPPPTGLAPSSTKPIPKKPADTTKPAPEPRQSKRRRREEEAADHDLDTVSCSSSEIDERELNARPNIRHVVYCNFKFNAWYRSPRYFDESSPSGIAHSAPSLHLSKQLIKTEYNKEIETIRQARKERMNEKLAASEPGAAGEGCSRDSESNHGPEGLIDTLYICDTCFRYTSESKEMAIHIPKCPYRLQLPGRVVYDSPYYQIRKVDGARHLLYVQCLSLFAKLFLDHKSICYALETFDFYILTTSVANLQGVNQFALNNCEVELAKGQSPAAQQLPSDGLDAGKRAPKPEPAPALVPTELSSPLSSQRVVGFFSKEKVSWDNYNLACITTFPPFQKRGLGKLLIEYSYYLSRKSKIVGTPERPLSTEGFLTYLKYWSNTISIYVSRRYYDWEMEQKLEPGQRDVESQERLAASQSNQKTNSDKGQDVCKHFDLSVSEISKGTYIKEDDVLKALEYMNVLKLTCPDSTLSGSETGDYCSVGDYDNLDTSSHARLVLDMDRVAEWVQSLRVKSSIVPLYEEYCIVRRRTKAEKKEGRSGSSRHKKSGSHLGGSTEEYNDSGFQNEDDEYDDYEEEYETEHRPKRRRRRIR